MKRVMALFVVILLTSAGTVAASNVTFGKGAPDAGDNGRASVTLGLLKAVDRLANYTEKIIGGNVSNETLAVYEEANELREKAWEEYKLGNQTAAIRYAVKAMHLYRRVIMSVERGKTEGMEKGKMERWKLQNALRVQLSMAVRELRYAELIMNRTNVTPEFILAYNQTKRLVEKVKADVASGNSTALKEDFPKLVRARVELQRQIFLVTSHAFRNHVVWAAGWQVRSLDELLPRLVGIREGVALNVSLVRGNVTANLIREIGELKALREELRQAMLRGDQEEVVRLLMEINRKLLEIKILLIKEGKAKGIIWKSPVVPEPWKGHCKAHGSKRP